ncbi:hypothetical protein [Streptomyces sp. NPDC088794]|uniref:hypothetical protein n=1 Tax=Streptomyces sp. NPDC088794 TaxID=3365902 RepID=UPI003811328B
MTLTLIAGGRHTGRFINTRLRRQVRELDDHNAHLVAGVEQREADLYTALLRGCQDAMLIAQLRAENEAVKAANEELRHTVIRAKAEQERLRRAVINARPKIGVAVQQLDRPYVSHTQIPYPVPVGQSTANDETQQLPVIDRPEPAPQAWPSYTH